MRASGTCDWVITGSVGGNRRAMQAVSIAPSHCGAGYSWPTGALAQPARASAERIGSEVSRGFTHGIWSRFARPVNRPERVPTRPGGEGVDPCVKG